MANRIADLDAGVVNDGVDVVVCSVSTSQWSYSYDVVDVVDGVDVFLPLLLALLISNDFMVACHISTEPEAISLILIAYQYRRASDE